MMKNEERVIAFLERYTGVHKSVGVMPFETFVSMNVKWANPQVLLT